MATTANAADRAALLDRDREFFAALTEGDSTALESLLAPDFVIVEISSGSVFARADLIGAVASGAVRFPAVQAFPDEAVLRRVGSVGIVVGRTAMRFVNADGSGFTSGSRYTHVYALDGDTWRLLSAQGTEIKPAE